MELTEENINKLWDFWIGSEMLIPSSDKKTLIRPKNLLGSVEHHKKSFMKATKIYVTGNPLYNKVTKEKK